MQLLPHAPQLLVLVLRFASHPLLSTLSQFAYPLLQLVSVQVPDEQDSAALARLQAVPQLPQLVVLFNGVSQPLFTLPSQLPQSASQLGAQLPPEQAAEPWSLVQVIPQPPQLVILVAKLTSQPSVGLPLQSE